MSNKTLTLVETINNREHPTGNGRSRLENKIRFETLLQQAVEAKTEVKKQFPIGNGPHDVVRALQAYLNSDETKARFNHYFVDGSELFYRTVSTVGGNAELLENTIAKKIDGFIVGNSSALPLIGRQVNWGRVRENRGETEVQRLMSEAGCLMIPFTVFQQAKLNIDAFKLVDKGPEETITRDFDMGYDRETQQQKIETRDVHFTGASLFTVDGSQFLFDVDRGELKHRIFNPFLVKLPKPVSTIAEAYESLKPQAVLDAEKAGLTVLRQGEWFLIPVPSNEAPSAPRSYFQPATLRAGPNRPNQAESALYLDENGRPMPPPPENPTWQQRDSHRRTLQDAKTILITGKLSHSGREHKTLDLKGLYRPVPNTATESWTIVGDVD